MIFPARLRLSSLRRPLRPQGLTYPRFFGTKSDPLRILFCGSDEFSIASLKAVHDEQKRDPQGIASIDVVCRPGKRTGRSLKTIREVPIKSVAKDLDLPIHEIDTFTGWTPPSPQGAPINLIIAVSFGLFIPSRLLNGAKYGGLNVHPSLLPDLRGPAPLHRALMAGDLQTGVTLQTLDTKHFDRGLILDQTSPFDIPYPCDITRLLSLASERGAQLLADGIRSRLFVPPLMEAPICKHIHASRHAPKIQTEDRHPDWLTWSGEKIRRYQGAVGPLWNTASTSTQFSQRKRVILTSIETVDLPLVFHERLPDDRPLPQVEPGLPFTNKSLDSVLNRRPYLQLPDTKYAEEWHDLPLYVFASDGTLMRINALKVEGEKEAAARRAALKAKLLPGPAAGKLHCKFYGRLQ